MSWHEAIGEDLPPRRPDEPAALRDDITSELADHLTCAMRRELRRTDDERAARANVLERFGDPARVARRLWLDAMKEMIMRDRILLAGIAVMALVSIGAAALAWRALDTSREMNQAILAQLAQLREPAQPVAAPDDESAHVMFRVVHEDDLKRPIAGARVELEGRAFSAGGDSKLSEVTDKEGRVSFGPVRAEVYKYTVTGLPNAPERGEATVTLYPGERREMTLVHPVPEETTVAFDVELPEDLRGRGFLIQCHLFDQRTAIAKHGTSWTFEPQQWQVHLNADDGTILTNVAEVDPEKIDRDARRLFRPWSRGRIPPYRAVGVENAHPQWDRYVGTRAVGSTGLSRLTVLAPVAAVEGMDLVAWKEFATHSVGGGPHSIHFERTQDGSNVWSFRLPHELAQELRTVLERAEAEAEAVAETQPG